jgi:peptidoglycan/xylan/chitin deacetylase (PgdA/CDA1 family)
LFVKTPRFLRAFFPSLIWKINCYQKNIWLTFDDGPCPESTPFILNILKQEKIKATFFLVGKKIEQYPNLFNEIIKDGHVVANHSYSHKNGWLCDNKTYFNDIQKCQELMPENKIFRPPYGKISPLQIRKIKKYYKIILWDVLSWDFSTNITPKRIKENILKNTVTGSILVLHNNKKSFRNFNTILQETIQTLKKKEFLFSTTW